MGAPTEMWGSRWYFANLEICWQAWLMVREGFARRIGSYASRLESTTAIPVEVLTSKFLLTHPHPDTRMQGFCKAMTFTIWKLYEGFAAIRDTFPEYLWISKSQALGWLQEWRKSAFFFGKITYVWPWQNSFGEILNEEKWFAQVPLYLPPSDRHILFQRGPE